MPTTVIIGGGIIGLSTAYYLAQLADSDVDPSPSSSSTPSSAPNTSTHTPNPPSSKPRHEIHLIESSPTLFASASGKAAGFLARDWFAPAVAPLGAFSFDLHRELAQREGGRERWGWSESVSWSLDRDSGDERSEGDGEEEEGDGEGEGESGYESEEEEDGEEEFHDAEEGVPVDGHDAAGTSANGHANAHSHTNGHAHSTANGHAHTNGHANGTAHANGHASNGGHAHANGHGAHKSRTRSDDLGWLMDGSSRATLLDDPQVAASGSIDTDTNDGADADENDADTEEDEDDEYPRWLRAKRSALQAISDRATTAQV